MSVRQSDSNPGLLDGRPRCEPDNHAHLICEDIVQNEKKQVHNSDYILFNLKWYEISYVDTLCISINDDVKNIDFFSRSKMIKLVVCSLVLLILIKSSHQDPEDEEIQKRFNNAHLLRGRRRYLDNHFSVFISFEEILQKTIYSSHAFTKKERLYLGPFICLSFKKAGLKNSWK